MQSQTMTVSQLTNREQMENKTQTTPPEFKEVTTTMTDAEILADSYSISKSISNIILKKYARLAKKNGAKMIILVLLSIMISGCVVGFYDQNQTPIYKLTKINNIVNK